MDSVVKHCPRIFEMIDRAHQERTKDAHLWIFSARASAKCSRGRIQGKNHIGSLIWGRYASLKQIFFKVFYVFFLFFVF